jgi:Tfp pilus assembly protein PilN
MLEQLKNRISDIQSIGSIELQIDANGNLVAHWVVLSKRKHILEVEKSGTVKEDLSILPTLLPVSIPIVLSLAGKGILHKKVQQQGSDKLKLFDYVFPNARITEYAVQYQPCADNGIYVSVIRKDQAERLVKEIADMGYSVLSMSLGSFAVAPLLKAIEFPNGQLSAGKHQSVIDKGTVSEYSYTANETIETIDIGDQKISSVLLTAYAMGFQYLVAGIEKIETTLELFDQAQSDYREKRVFKVLSAGGLIFFFALLVINTIAYSLLSESNNRLSAEYGSLQHVTVSNKKGTEEFNRKEAFLSQAGWLNPAAISYYSDRIASSLPDEIQLTSLAVYPFDEQISRKNKKEIFEPNMILVKGVSRKPTDINRWVKLLNEYSWIKQIKVQDYTFDHKTGTGNFSLHILISGELE